MNVMNEEKIITQIIKGDTEAYRLLIDRYQAGLIIHCENIMKNRQDGEDIAQEAFIKAFDSLSSFSSQRAKFSTWLYRIATNVCIDQLRRHRRKVHIKDVEAFIETTEPSYMEDEEKLLLQKVISELEPPKYGEIIRAYFWEGKSYQELAAEYHTSTNTVGTWMRRAKAQLRGKLS